MIATRDAILAADDLATSTVDTDEWGTVRIRTMTGVERDEFDAMIVSRKNAKGFNDPTEIRARLVVLCAIDENGARLFKDEDIPQLQQKAAKPLGIVADKVAALNGLDGEEEAEKNS